MKYYWGLLFFGSFAFATPQVIFSNGAISVLPDPKNPPVKEQIDILEQDNCPSQKAARRVSLGARCDFFRGLYRYAFRDKGKEAARAVFIEFTAYRSGNGYAFVSAAPVELLSN